MYLALSDTIGKLSWNIELSKNDVKALEDGGMTPKIHEMCLKAVAAQTRMVKDMKKLLDDKHLKKWSEFDNFKKSAKSMESNITKIEHIQNWSEMPDESALCPDSVNKLLLEIATTTELANELLETAKGFIKSEKK